MLLELPTKRSDINLPDLHEIAINTGFIERESTKMDASKFVQTVIEAAISGAGSCNQMAANLGNRTLDPMTSQGMEERFKKDSIVAFFTAVHEALLNAHLAPISDVLSGSKINRFLVEDSSGKKLPKSNSVAFPAHGNYFGSTAGVKINLVYDVLNAVMISHTLHRATEQDKTIGKDSLTHLQPNDLLVRDMGYFSLSEFTYIESLGAFCLTRLPLTCGVSMEDGKMLERALKSTKKKIVDLDVWASAERKKCRLVAIRVDKKTAKQRRKNRRQIAKEKGKTVCPKGILRDGWYIMLTNLERDQFSVKQLAEIYRVRWGVEIQFRAWKQSTNLDVTLNRTGKENHLMVLILGGMIAHLLGMLIGKVYTASMGLEKLSFEKLYDTLTNIFLKLICFEDILNIKIDPRHIQRNIRKRPIPTAKGVVALA